MEDLVVIWGLVVVCFLFFFLWLLAMATCPDRLVYLLSEAGPMRTYAKVRKRDVAEEEGAGLGSGAGGSSGTDPARDPWVLSGSDTVLPEPASLTSAPLSGILIHRSQEICDLSDRSSDMASTDAVQGSASIVSAYQTSLPKIEEEKEPLTPNTSFAKAEL